MKKSFVCPIIQLAVVMIVMAGCNSILDVEGRKVKFTASVNLSPATKTSYGEFVDGFQLINWVGGANADVIRIYSPDAYIENASFSENAGSTGTATPWHSGDPAFSPNHMFADYKIDGISTSGHKSIATLENVGVNGLSWSGTGDGVFYGAYPHTTAVTSNDAGKLRFVPFVPGGNGDATPGIQDGDSAKVSIMPLLAMKTVPGGSNVNLDFYPAFNAFAFHLKSVDETLIVQSVELYIDPSYTEDDMFLTGYCYYDLNAVSPGDSYDSHYLPNSALSFTSASKSLKVNLDNATISATTEAYFTLFTLPCTLDHLCFRVNYTHNGTAFSKMLRLTQNSSWVSFPAGHKAVITGLAVKPDIWTFNTITLKGVPLEWKVEGISTSSDKLPQASQFAVTGTGVKNVYEDLHHTSAGKPYRQYWVLPTSGTTAKVTFDIMSPFGGTYTITPAGNVDDFVVAYFKEDGITATTNTGAIGRTDGTKKLPTKVIFTVTPKSTASTTSKLWFNVTVKASDADGGEVYNIDSETQLYDMRGYHYFVTKDPLE